MSCCAQRKALEDEALLSDHNIKDDAILYMTLQQGARGCPKRCVHVNRVVVIPPRAMPSPAPLW